MDIKKTPSKAKNPPFELKEAETLAQIDAFRLKIKTDQALLAKVEELALARKELTHQYKEKSKRADELIIANKELLFQNLEKEKRVNELIIANQEKANRADELIAANEEKVKLAIINEIKLRTSLMETIEIARDLGELRDPYTAGHERHVGQLAKALGAELGLDEQRQTGLMIAGYLHDVGKIIVPAEILCKPGKLTKEEYALVKTHVQTGYELLKNITFPWEVAQTVLEHHERMDGSGYPNQLEGEQISLDGRILAVADVVEAMSVFRPYRPALGIDVALAEIERGRGTMYDAQVVDACLELFHNKQFKILS